MFIEKSQSFLKGNIIGFNQSNNTFSVRSSNKKNTINNIPPNIIFQRQALSNIPPDTYLHSSIARMPQELICNDEIDNKYCVVRGSNIILNDSIGNNFCEDRKNEDNSRSDIQHQLMVEEDEARKEDEVESDSDTDEESDMDISNDDTGLSSADIWVYLQRLSNKKRQIMTTSSCGRMIITNKSAPTLLPGSWLDNEIMNFFCDSINKFNATSIQSPYWISNTWFFSRLMNVSTYGELGKFNYKAIKRLLVLENVRVWDLQRIFIPIHVDCSHWVYVNVDVEKKHVSIYDSLNDNSNSHNRKLLDICKRLLRWYTLELKESKVRITTRSHVFYINNPVERETTIRILDIALDSVKSFEVDNPNSLKQHNSCDCGIFVLVNMFATLMLVTDTRREQWNADVISSARQIFASFLKFRKQY